MKRIYEDPSIPITQDDQFDLPPDFDPCKGEYLEDGQELDAIVGDGEDEEDDFIGVEL